MQCTTHPNKPAAGNCAHSGKPFCDDCLAEVDGRLYGKPYLSQAVAEIRERDRSKAQNPMVFMNAGGAAVTAPPAASIDAPFFRRRWVIVLLVLFLPPIAFLLIITGKIYRWSGASDSWVPVSSTGKAFFALWALAYIVVAIMAA